MEYKINFSGKGHLYTQKELEQICDVAQGSDPLTQGHYRNLFEKKARDYLNVPHAFSLCNATAGLELAAQMCLFQDGDEVIAPSHTFTSSVYPFIKYGAKIVWADISLPERVVTLETIKKCVTKKTKAIIVVHLYGYMAEIEEISNFAKENNILLVEDVAQAMGTERNGKKAGSFGDFAVFSFHSHKNITTLGEGGMIVCKDEKYANIIPLLRHNGHVPFDHQKQYWKPAMSNLVLPKLEGKKLIPHNFCIGEVECALGSLLIDRLDILNCEKRKRAIAFIDEMKNFDFAVFHRVDNPSHNYHLLVAQITNDKRDQILGYLSDTKGIKCVVQYYPLNRYPLYQELGFGFADCPNADTFFDNMISFPFHHWMSKEDFDYLVDSTREALRLFS